MSARTMKAMHSAADESGAEDLQPLLEAARSGDESAWRSLVERYGRRVFALARSRCGRSDVAEEVTQSVFATVAAKLGSGEYAEQGRFESWLFRVAMNRVRDELRRQGRQASPTDPGALTGVRVVESGPDREDLPEELARLREAMGRLSEADRDIVELRHHGGLSFKQMSELLNEPMGTLLARHHRALRKLRDLMEGARRGPREGVA